jgi:F-type H+-transporting ATPase subunit a
MAHEPTNPLDALKDPFEHSADSYHWSFFPTAGLEIDHLPVSKFIILETIAFLIVLAVFLPACRRIARGDVPRGRFAHFVEAILLFIRDEVAIPTTSASCPYFGPSSSSSRR